MSEESAWKRYLTNAFSLGMLTRPKADVLVKEITLERAIELMQEKFISAVGHEATAQFITQLTGIPVSTNRINVALRDGDELLVFQLLGRLPEGKILTIEEMKNIPYKIYHILIDYC